MTNLETLSTAQLVALHNEHAQKPVRRFSNRATAIKRTAAVLPNRKQGKAAALLGDFKATVGTAPFAVEATAKRLNVSEKMVRNCIDLLRRQGGKASVENIGKGTFQITRLPAWAEETPRDAAG